MILLSRFKRSEINEYMKTIRELQDEDLIVKDVHSSHKSNFYRCEKKLENIQACAGSMQFGTSSHGTVTGTNFVLGSYK